MNGKVKIDKNHPDYKEYIEKCEALQEQLGKEIEPLTGADGDKPLEAIFSKYNKKIKVLQEEYSYLFTEVVDHEDE